MKKLFFGLLVGGCSLLLSPLNAQGECCDSRNQCNPCCDKGSFEGFYLGGNLGVISHTAYRNDLDGFFTDNSGWVSVDTDVTLGIQLGYDWLCDYRLLGLVVDWNWANNDRRLRDEPNDPSDDNRIDMAFDWYTTIRARAGLAVCDALVYLTVGAAVAQIDTRWHDAPNTFNVNDSRWGWTGGIGTEFLAWCNWSVGAEVLFMHFGDRESSFTTLGGDRQTFGHSDNVWVGRILLNYRFGDLCSCFGR